MISYHSKPPGEERRHGFKVLKFKVNLMLPKRQWSVPTVSLLIKRRRHGLLPSQKDKQMWVYVMKAQNGFNVIVPRIIFCHSKPLEKEKELCVWPLMLPRLQ